MTDVATTTRPIATSRRESLVANLPAGWSTTVTVAGAWILLILASGIHRADFLSHQTVLAVSFTMAIVGVLAVAQALVGISGGILDLSQPTALVLSAAIVAKLLELGVPVPLVVVAGILVGAAWGFCNAAIIVFGKLNPIIVTLGTNFIGVAVMFLIYQNAQAPLKSGFSDFGRNYFLGLPNIWWPMAILVLLVGYFLPRTRYGRHAIAVGGNRFAAQTRGISLRKTRFAIFTASGAIVGLGGILFAASNGPFAPSAGSTFQLPVIAAVILAGVSLAGGPRQHLADPAQRRLSVHGADFAGVLRLFLELAGGIPGPHPDSRRRHRRLARQEAATMTTDSPSATPSGALDTRRLRDLLTGSVTSIAVTLVAVIAVGLGWVGPNFLSASNVTIIGTFVAVPMLIAAFSGFALLAGVVDLSIGSMVGFSSAVTATLMSMGWPLAAAAAARPCSPACASARSPPPRSSSSAPMRSPRASACWWRCAASPTSSPAPAGRSRRSIPISTPSPI